MPDLPQPDMRIAYTDAQGRLTREGWMRIRAMVEAINELKAALAALDVRVTNLEP